MVILGIDPGYGIVGYGVIETDGNNYQVLDYGAITTPKENSIAVRLQEIEENLIFLLNKFKPDVVAIEELFYFKNQTTIIPVAQARGVIVLTAQKYCGKLYEYTPLQIKQALTGNGRAEKAQVQYMVKSILGLSSIPKPDDAADALAVAICHSQTSGTLNNNFI